MGRTRVLTIEYSPPLRHGGWGQLNPSGLCITARDRLHTLRRTDDAGHYQLQWTGRIALAYSGDNEFRYQFTAKAERVRFDAISLWYFDPHIAKEYLGIDIDPKASPAEYIAPYVQDSGQFIFEKRNGTLYAVRRYAR